MSARTYGGGCHCGNVAIRLDSEKTPSELGWRADGCSFCVKHDARYTSDPQGRAHVVVRDGGRLGRYRFGTRTADFLVCASCGVFVGAFMEGEGGGRLVVNVNCLDDLAEFAGLPLHTATLDGEPLDQRLARRRARWTPVASFVVAPAVS